MQASNLRSEAGEDNAISGPSIYSSEPPEPLGFKQRINTGIASLREAMTFMINDARIRLLLLTFIANTIGASSLAILLQSVSRRYGWTIAQAGVLLSIRSAVNIVLFILVMPAVTWILTSRIHLSPRSTDVWLVKVGTVFVPLGFLMMAISPGIGLTVVGLIINTFGAGNSFIIRSLMTSIVEPESVARLYTSIAIFETFGTVISGPLMAALFKQGLELGGQWLGMPYFVAAIATSMSMALVWQVPLSPRSSVENNIE